MIKLSVKPLLRILSFILLVILFGGCGNIPGLESSSAQEELVLTGRIIVTDTTKGRSIDKSFPHFVAISKTDNLKITDAAGSSPQI